MKKLKKRKNVDTKQTKTTFGVLVNQLTKTNKVATHKNYVVINNHN